VAWAAQEEVAVLAEVVAMAVPAAREGMAARVVEERIEMVPQVAVAAMVVMPVVVAMAAPEGSVATVAMVGAAEQAASVERAGMP